MENEVNEVLEATDVNELENVNRGSSKAKILGVAVFASIAAVLLKFRKKIGAGIEKSMVKSLTKKGYSVNSPVDVKVIPDDLMDPVE